MSENADAERRVFKLPDCITDWTPALVQTALEMLTDGHPRLLQQIWPRNDPVWEGRKELALTTYYREFHKKGTKNIALEPEDRARFQSNFCNAAGTPGILDIPWMCDQPVKSRPHWWRDDFSSRTRSQHQNNDCIPAETLVLRYAARQRRSHDSAESKKAELQGHGSFRRSERLSSRKRTRRSSTPAPQTPSASMRASLRPPCILERVREHRPPTRRIRGCVRGHGRGARETMPGALSASYADGTLIESYFSRAHIVATRAHMTSSHSDQSHMLAHLTPSHFDQAQHMIATRAH